MLRWLPVALWLLVLVSACVQIALVHWHRELVGEWQRLDKARTQLQQEHTRLLLEKSTLTAHGRIDREARKQLNMKEATDVQVIPL